MRLAFLLLGMTVAPGGPPAAIVAHRGASHDAPENTLASFRLAFEQGADAIEGDFHLSRDRRIVCIHDATTQRTTGVEGKVAEMTFDELRALDAGKWKGPAFAGERIPTLAEVLALVKPGKRAFLELKAGKGIVEPALKEVDASGLGNEQVAMISFKEDVLAEVKRARPQARAYLLFSFKKDKQGNWNQTRRGLIGRAAAIRADGIDVGLHPDTLEVVDEELARLAGEAGLELHVYTVNDPELARRAVRLGARSITTDRPGFLRERL